MEKGVDELIDFLLEEIAVVGTGGVDLRQLTHLTTSFYQNEHTETDENRHSVTPKQILDDGFICAIWKRLGQHPDIAIGRKQKHNQTSLQDLRAGISGFSSTKISSIKKLPRIMTTEDRVYNTICGHERAVDRVTPLEWALLDCIAATRAEGILQGDLGRQTKQNKHSVPARTNRLQAGGYIVKQPFMLGNTKTSRCVLRRYIDGQKGAYPLPQPPDDPREPDQAEAAMSAEELESETSSPAPISTLATEPHTERTDEANEKEQLESDDGNISYAASSPVPKRRRVKQTRRAIEMDQFDFDDSDVPSVTSVSSQKRHTKRKIQAKEVYQNDSDHVKETKGARGRPRRFLRGTEKFWQWQFWQAKVSAVEGDETPTKRSGVMHDPAGLALFNARPADFDQTLVDARSVNFPVPGMPQEISENWVKQTRLVLESRQPGAYATPTGVHVGKFLVRSKILVVRSSRLEELDFSNDKKAPRYRFITSSLAHSKALLPTQEPKGRRGRKAKQEAVDAENIGTNVLFLTTSAAHTLRYYPPGRESTAPEISKRDVQGEENDPTTPRGGPRKGVFREANIRPPTLSKSSKVAEEPPHMTAVEYRELMDSTESDSDSALPGKRSLSTIPSGRESRTSTSVGSGDQHKIIKGDRDTKQQKWDPPPGKIALSTATAHRSFAQNASITTGDATNSVAFDLVEAGRSIDRLSSPAPSKKRTLSLIDTDDCGQPLPNPAKRQRIRTTNALELGRIIRQLIVDLLVAAGGAGPADPTIVSTSIAARWQTTDAADIPGRDVIKKIIQSMWDGGNLRKIYFSVVALDGTFHQRPIIALESTDPEGALVRGLKDKIRAADKGDYIPPEWQASSITSFPTPARQTAVSKTQKRNRRKGVSLLTQSDGLAHNPETSQEQSQDSLPRDKQSLSFASNTSDGPVASSRPDQRLRPSSLQESISSSDLGVPVATIGRSRRARKPTVKATSIPVTEAFEDSSSDSELEELGHEGFLTLKVPRLGIHLQDQRSNAELRALATATRPVIVPDTVEEAASPAAPEASPARRVRNRYYVPRKNKDRRFEPKTLRPVWENLDGYLHATCLQDILEAQASYDLKLRPRPHGNPMERAFDKVDIVWAWEERVEEDMDGIDHEGHMINHVAVVDPDLSAPLSTWSLVSFSEDGEMAELEHPTFESWPRFVKALVEAAKPVIMPVELVKPAAIPRRPRPRKERPAPKKRGAEEITIDDNSIDDEEPLVTKRPERSTAGRRRRQSSDTSIDSFDAEFSVLRRTKNKTAQSARKPTLPILSDDEAYDLSLAVTVIRTLAGGIKKTIPWPLVQSLFPDMPLEHLQQYWQAICNVHYTKIQITASHFQETYLSALENNEVPTINFDNLTTTDWPTIITWAKSILLTAPPPPKQPEPPKIDFTTRTSLLSTHTLTYRQRAPLHEVLATKTTASTWRREGVASTHVFGIPLLPTHSPAVPTPSDLSLARSAILSTLLTPTAHFSPHMAAARLTALAPDPTASESLVRSALDSLIRDKLIVRRTKTAGEVGVRTYCVSDIFTSLFARGVNVEMLRVANAYKVEVLDRAFGRAEVLRLGKERMMEDGEMVCLLGLMGRGLVTVRAGGDLPGGRYGVDWERVGYKVEKIGRLGVGFEVAIEMAEGYVYGVGNDMMVGGEVPIGEEGRMPVWVGADGNVMKEVWEMILASVLGTISLRPGSGVEEISDGLGNAVGEWEVEMVLTWAQNNGFLRKTRRGKGFDTEDWWWTCVGKGEMQYNEQGFLAGQQRQTPSETEKRETRPRAEPPRKSMSKEAQEAEVRLPGTKDSLVAGRMTGLQEWSLVSTEADTAAVVGTRSGRRTKATLLADDDAGAMTDDDDDAYEDI